MAMMLAKTYEAFRDAGASDDKAREAAEEIAGFENRQAAIEADMKLLKWMLGGQPGVLLGDPGYSSAAVCGLILDAEASPMAIRLTSPVGQVSEV